MMRSLRPFRRALILPAMLLVSGSLSPSWGQEPLKGSITAADGSEMVLIPVGDFMMGSPEGSGDKDERPQRKVRLDAYYMDKCEVTSEQYAKFLNAYGKDTDDFGNKMIYCERSRMGAVVREKDKWQPLPGKEKCPVVFVTWHGASQYARHYGKRLPTEAEWEKACRAGSVASYCFGDSGSELGDYAWCGANSKGSTHPVGGKKPNAYGICDMYGNVWEYCADWYDKDYYANAPAVNPQGPASGFARVVRGGSWGCNTSGGSPYYCRSAYRSWLCPVRSGDYGFRCAMSVAAPSKPPTDVAGPGIVGTTRHFPLWMQYQRRCFRANGRFWAFWFDGHNGSGKEVYSSSVDGIAWSASTPVFELGGPPFYSLCYDGARVHNVTASPFGRKILYRRGTPGSDGSISWEEERTAVAEAPQISYERPYVGVDSNGCPWIAYSQYCPKDGRRYPYVARSSSNDGTWNLAPGFPYRLSEKSSFYGCDQAILPLKDGKMFAFYVQHFDGKAQVWNGSEWLPEIQAPPGDFQGEQGGGRYWSAVAHGNDAHIVFLSSGASGWNSGIGYLRYDGETGRFADRSAVPTSPSQVYFATGASLCVNPKTGSLYCIWVDSKGEGSSGARRICFSRRVNGAWDAAPATWLERPYIPTGDGGYSCFEQAWDGYVGLLFTSGHEASVLQPPFDVNFISMRP